MIGRVLVAAVLSAALFGCDRNNQTPPDSGVVVTPHDAAVNADATVRADAETQTDASIEADAETADAETQADATTPADAEPNCDGSSGCWACEPTNSGELLNHCGPGFADCVPFDNATRLPLIQSDG